MTDDLIELVDRLSEVLVEENALLEVLDLPAAVLLLTRKRDAVAALQGAFANGITVADPDAEKAELFRTSIQHLIELADVNRTAIERGLALQMRLIQTIAEAVPRARALEAPVYQKDGSQVPPRPADAYTFRSRM